ncbi:MAG: hypothetical protein GX444_12465 [Myxococcales bacterium]|nr:hypothetical protein [Myxococcales bacterium]
MRSFVDRWACLVALLALLALSCSTAGCGDDDDDNDSGNGDDDGSPDDDDASPGDDDSGDDDNDDNDTGDADEIRVEPNAEMIPAGTSFQYTASGIIGGVDVTDGFTWTIGDEAIATVNATGLVTGVANGQTEVIATLTDHHDSAYVLVGPDAYSFDNLAGVVTAVDRGNQTGVADLLAGKGSVGAVIQDIKFYEGYLLLTDSGDAGVGTTGLEKVVVVDLFDKSVRSRTLEMDSPWASAAVKVDFKHWIYTTGNLDNRLAAVELTDSDEDLGEPTYYDLDAACAPSDIVELGGLLYIACTGFHLDDFSYDPGKVIVFDPEAGQIQARLDLPQVNPSRFAPALDGVTLYVVCTGNYFDQFGQIVEIGSGGLTVVDSFDLGTAPGTIGIGGNGLAFVGEMMAGSVYVFDTADNTVLHGADDPLPIPDAFWIQGLGVHPDDGGVYVCDQGNGVVRVLAGEDPFAEVFHVSLPNPGGVAFW